MTLRRGRDCALLALAVGASAAVYWPITHNYFMADDFISLQSIANDSLARWLLQPASGHILVVRNALFALCYRVFGTWAAGYFWVVLLTHLVNVALLFAVVRRLTGSAHLACFGAVLWGTSPADEGSLGWYAVYGHVVVGTVVLWVLWRIAGRREEPGPLAPLEALRWCALLLVASTAFGVGLGVALVLPAVVLLVFPGARSPRPTRIVLAAFPMVVLGEYAGLYALYTYLYGGRAGQDLLTILGTLRQWSSVLAMLLHLLIAGWTGLLAGFVVPASAYPSPLADVLAAAFLLAFAYTLIGSPPRSRRLLLAMALLALGAYAVIAAGRGGLYQAFPGTPAYGASAPRYHYVGPLALDVVLCLVLARLGERLRLRSRTTTVLLAASLGIVALLYHRSAWCIDHHEADRQATEEVVLAIRAAIDGTPRGRPVYIANRPFSPAVLGAPYFAGWASLFTVFFPSGVGRPVYFVEGDGVVRAVALPGSPLAAILVAAEVSSAGSAAGPETLP